jgi:hypothetical protein
VRRLFLLVPLAALAASCGGGGDRLSHEELRTKVNAICGEVNREIAALGNPQSLEEVAVFASKATKLARDGVADLRALEPPEDAEESYDRFLVEGDKAVELSGRLERAARKEDAAELQRILREAQASDERSDRLAAGLGFDECAEDSA